MTLYLYRLHFFYHLIMTMTMSIVFTTQTEDAYACPYVLYASRITSNAVWVDG